MNGFKDLESVHKYYHDIFTKKKLVSRSNGNYYDFKKDEKEILSKIFYEIKEPNSNQVSFQAIIQFFASCQLYYLCYNIKPSQLENLLKESAHEHHDSLSRTEFLTLFYLDRPNITSYGEEDTLRVKKRCILSEESWKDLKAIFSTLDTFGDETIYLGPFIYKVKNNYGNRNLIN